jgi:KTSC domain-containing protein
MNAYSYDPASYVFGIQTTGGTPYFYLDVPPEVHAQFTQASSKGKFWLAYIKPKYQCQKGDGTVAKQSPTAAPVKPKVQTIIEAAADSANVALVKTTAALDKAVVTPISEMVADLRGQMQAHCMPLMEEIGELTDAALMMSVRDEESFKSAAELGKKLAAKRKGITPMMQPTKQAIDQVKEVVLNKEKELLGLAQQGEDHLKRICTEYRTETQRAAVAEADVERKRLLKEAEDRRIQQAEAAQAAGKTGLADKLLSTPVTAPKVEVKAAVPKVAGVSNRVNYRWRLAPGFDITKVPAEWLQLNESVVGKHARDSKLPDVTNQHGIEFYQDPDTNF